MHLQKGPTAKTNNPDILYTEIKGDHKNGINAIVDTKYPEQQGKEEKIIDKNRPPYSFINVFKSVATYLAFLGGGMGNSLFGATILQLQDRTMSSPNQIASIFTWRALGSMCGNLLVAILFDKIPPEVILCLGSLFLAVFTLSVPFCASFVALIVVIVLNGFSHGIIGGGCNSYIVKTWRLKSPPFLQALQFTTSFGSCISPLIVDAFVTDVFHFNQNRTITTDLGNNCTHVTASREYESNGSFISTNQSTLSETMNSYSELLYPFLIPALFMASASLAYAGALVLDILKFQKKRLSKVDSFLKQQKEVTGKITHKAQLALIIIFLIVYGGMECTYGSWIVAFSVKYMGTSFETAAFLCTAYWASLAGSRAISIITTKIFTPVFLICICLVISLSALIVMTTACTLHIAVPWVCSILIGASFAPTFGNIIAFSQQEFNISCKVTSVFVLCLYVGFMGMPALVGFLFVNFTPMYFLYVLTSGSVFITCIFFGIVIHKQLCR